MVALFILGLISSGIVLAEDDADLGERAASLAESLIGAPYLSGGKGWNWNPLGGWKWEGGMFVDSADITNGYYYYKPSAGKVAFGKGIDCSGLCFWAFNKAAEATSYRGLGNRIYAEGADGQWSDTERFEQHSKSVPSVSDLQPGFLLFLDTPSMRSGFPDHEAMYLGNGYVIHSRGGVGVEKMTLEDWLNLPVAGEKGKKYRDYFFGYGAVKYPRRVTDNPHLEWDTYDDWGVHYGHEVLDLSLSTTEWREGETVTLTVTSYYALDRGVTYVNCPHVTIVHGQVEIISVEPPARAVYTSRGDCDITCGHPRDGRPTEASDAVFTIKFRLGRPLPDRSWEPFIYAYLEGDPRFGTFLDWAKTGARIGFRVKGTEEFRTGVLVEGYLVQISSGSEVSDFVISAQGQAGGSLPVQGDAGGSITIWGDAKGSVRFTVQGQAGTDGFCRVSIPRGLMWCDRPEDWTVKIDGQPVDCTVTKDQYFADFTDIVFRYVHSSHYVEITSTHSMTPPPEYEFDDPGGDLFNSRGNPTSGEGDLDIVGVELAREGFDYVARIKLLGTLPTGISDPSVFIEWDLLVDCDRNPNTRSWGPWPLIDNGLGVDMLVRLCLSSDGYSGHILSWEGDNQTYLPIDYSVNEGIAELRFDPFLIQNPAAFDYVVAVREYVGNQVTADKSPNRGHATFPVGEWMRTFLAAVFFCLSSGAAKGIASSRTMTAIAH